MNSLSVFATNLRQITTHPTQLHRAVGNFIGDTASWIQVHDSIVTPASSAVPLKSIYVAVGSTTPQPWQIEFIDAAMVLKAGLFIGVSSAEGVYTAVLKNTDIQVDVEDVEQTVTVIGNLTTGVNSRNPVSEANGLTAPKKLYKIDALTSATGAVVALMVFAQDSPPNGTIPLMTLFQNADGSVLALQTQFTATFGLNGAMLSSMNPTTLAIRRGITLAWTTTLGTLTIDTNSDSYIRVEIIN